MERNERRGARECGGGEGQGNTGRISARQYKSGQSGALLTAAQFVVAGRAVILFIADESLLHAHRAVLAAVKPP